MAIAYPLYSDASMIYPTIVSAGVSGVLVLTQKWHGRITLDTYDGAQKFHVAPTPRIGGVALFMAVLAAFLFTGNATDGILGLMIIAGIPTFIVGTLEDLTKKVGVRERLIATMFSGFFACWITGYHIDHVDVPGIDMLLGFIPFAIGFTAFSIAGVANAINIIDGFNGLAGGVLMICFSMFGLIAYQVEDMSLVNLCLLLTLSVGGFMMLNFPCGKIFMGDGGAYFMGFMLAWVAVLLPARNASVSPWASIVVCAYPVIETLFSIWRKTIRKGYHPGKPDRVHFHMLMYQRVSRAHYFKKKTTLINGLTSLFILPITCVFSLAGITFYSSTILLIISFFFCFIVYYLVYLRLIRFRWCLW